jgi:hypothetical protein
MISCFYVGLFIVKVGYPLYCRYKGAPITIRANDPVVLIMHRLKAFERSWNKVYATYRLGKEARLPIRIRSVENMYNTMGRGRELQNLNDAALTALMKKAVDFHEAQEAPILLEKRLRFWEEYGELQEKLFNDAFVTVDTMEAAHALNNASLGQRFQWLWRSRERELEYIHDLRKRLEESETATYTLFETKALEYGNELSIIYFGMPGLLF